MFAALAVIPACNSDVPVSAVGEITPPGLHVTVTPPNGCSATSELFPDTGGVSRRNVYRGGIDRLYVVGQFDVRRFDLHGCRIELIEFRSVERDLLFVGS